MEVVYQNKVGETADIFQAPGILGEYLNRAGDACGCCGLYRHSFSLFERGMNDSDGLIFYLIHELCVLKLLPALKGVGQGNIVGVFQLGAEGQPSGEASGFDAQR